MVYTLALQRTFLMTEHHKSITFTVTDMQDKPVSELLSDQIWRPAP